ncbi:ribulose phosphate epimerase [Devosia sp. Leaf420]|uniref:L-ribulose-5-phosphate 4-epimerase n=1 Tax=Devosia sp. Leaf420 TaxID=1736374 RepID=UPI0007155E1B|nr:L-ribulose-5-phosphate 4-epimerase [Devosia sp. Leaf420]KQT48135.1 ribulose phosphate epimerase [Devosia sp. Leaf420]
MYEDLREAVYQANLQLVEAKLVVLTWGNASGVDRQAGVMAIKPSGMDYRTMTADDIPVLSLETGEVIYGNRRPSSDTPTHRVLYNAMPSIGGVVHTHSPYGTSFAQARHAIPCYGTTHADNFHGPIPFTRDLTEEEIGSEYELNTGKVIVETFDEMWIDPLHVPGVLVGGHAPFTWGKDTASAVENAIVLEFSAMMACQSLSINPQTRPIPQSLLDKHFFRKHGPSAYYGQRK